MEIKLIEVTDEDIFKGQEYIRNRIQGGLSRNCGIALAVQRAFNDPSAKWNWTLGEAAGHDLRVVPTEAARVDNWVTTHDALKKVHPFSFAVEIRN